MDGISVHRSVPNYIPHSLMCNPYNETISLTPSLIFHSSGVL